MLHRDVKQYRNGVGLRDIYFSCKENAGDFSYRKSR